MEVEILQLEVFFEVSVRSLGRLVRMILAFCVEFAGCSAGAELGLCVRSEEEVGGKATLTLKERSCQHHHWLHQTRNAWILGASTI